jgi:hypothetical protein
MYLKSNELSPKKGSKTRNGYAYKFIVSLSMPPFLIDACPTFSLADTCAQCAITMHDTNHVSIATAPPSTQRKDIISIFNGAKRIKSIFTKHTTKMYHTYC